MIQNEARQFLARCGSFTMLGGPTGPRLIRPKFRGRILRMLAMYQGALLQMQFGCMPVSFFDACAEILWKERYEYEKITGIRTKPKCIYPLAGVCKLGFKLFDERNSIELIELQRFNRNASYVLGTLVWNEIVQAVVDQRPFYKGSKEPMPGDNLPC